MDKLTAYQIAKLHDEAMANGDCALERTCRAALNDHGTVTRADQQRARARCTEAINATRAQAKS